MSSDPASSFANLFIYYYENKWINKFKKTNAERMTHFDTIFGFIDDLTALSEFERSFHEVYPPELESKKEQHGYLEGSFLDLLISMEDKKCCTILFEKKKRTVSIFLVHMPYLDSNIASKSFHSTFSLRESVSVILSFLKRF